MRRPDRDQGPEPDGRRPDDVRVAGVRRLRARGLRRGDARHRGGRHGQPRQDLDAGVRLAVLHRARGRCRPRSPPGTGRGWRAVRPAERRRRWPPDWCRSPRAPTAAARSGSRPRAAAWSGSSPRRGRISGHPMYGDPVGLGTSGADRPQRPRRGGDAGRARRSSGGRSCLGASPLVVVPVGLRPRPGAAPDRAVQHTTGRRHRRRSRVPRGPTRTPRRCSSSSATTSRTCRLRWLRDAVPDLRDLLGGADRAVGGAARGRAAAAAAHPLAVRARTRRVAARSSGWRSASCAALRPAR